MNYATFTVQLTMNRLNDWDVDTVTIQDDKRKYSMRCRGETMSKVLEKNVYNAIERMLSELSESNRFICIPEFKIKTRYYIISGAICHWDETSEKPCALVRFKKFLGDGAYVLRQAVNNSKYDYLDYSERSRRFIQSALLPIANVATTMHLQMNACQADPRLLITIKNALELCHKVLDAEKLYDVDLVSANVSN